MKTSVLLSHFLNKRLKKERITSSGSRRNRFALLMLATSSSESEKKSSAVSSPPFSDEKTCCFSSDDISLPLIRKNGHKNAHRSTKKEKRNWKTKETNSKRDRGKNIARNLTKRNLARKHRAWDNRCETYIWGKSGACVAWRSCRPALQSLAVKSLALVSGALVSLAVLSDNRH